MRVFKRLLVMELGLVLRLGLGLGLLREYRVVELLLVGQQRWVNQLQ
jgi:hypothetical protein